jgi:hypothetical protein
MSAHRRHRPAALFVLTAALALSSVLAPSSSAAPSGTAQTRSASDESGIYLEGIRQGDRVEPFADMIEKAAAPGSPYTEAQVRALLESLKTDAEAGQDVSLAHQEAAGPSADVRAIDNALQALDGPQSLAPAADADPSNYTVTGHSTNQGRSWRIPDFGMDQYYCGEEGCELRDHYNIAFTINPARNNDWFQYTALYFPRSTYPLFEDIYVTVGDYTARGVNNGDADINNEIVNDGNGSSTFTLNHAGTAGLQTQQLLRLHYFSVIYSTTVYVRVRTGLATCKTGSNYNCIY